MMAAGIIFPAAAFAYGDEDEQVAEDTRKMVLVDGKNIQNKTDSPKANFKAMVDRINHELVSCGLFRVLNEEDWETALKEAEKSAVAADDGGIQTDIKSAGYVLKLSISQYGFSKEYSTDIYGNKTVHQVAKVELTLRIADLKNGQTYRSVNLARQMVAGQTALAVAGQYKSGNYAENALQAACAEVAKDIVKELVKLTPFYVIGVEDGMVILDVPAAVAKKGMLFEIRKAGKARVNRRTGKKTVARKSFCVVQVVNVSEDSCDTRIVAYFPEFQGQKISEDGTGFSVHQASPEILQQFGGAAPAAAPAAPATGTYTNPF